VRQEVSNENATTFSTVTIEGGTGLNCTDLGILAIRSIVAGDCGLLYEELTRSATREEAGEVAGKNLDLYLCVNRTCEVGMEHAAHAPCESFVYALDGLTRER
jgi:hypothetical protein